jgi:hypothetical protein
MVFEWDDATINTSGTDAIEGTRTIENSLGSYLGDGIQFKEVTGYIYVCGITDDATLSMNYNDGATHDLVPPKQILNKEVTRPSFTDPIKNELPRQSLPEPILMTDMLNSDSVVLDYSITIPTMKLVNNDTSDNDKEITADLVILLRMEFEVRGETFNSDDAEEYVKLNIPDIFPKPDGGDLFLRKSKDDELFQHLDKLKIYLNNPKNDIIEGLAILVSAKDENGINNAYEEILKFKDKASLEMDFGDDFPFPFSPQFEILLEKDKNELGGGYEDYAPFKLKRSDPNNPLQFDFDLAVEVRTNINITIPPKDSEEK